MKENKLRSSNWFGCTGKDGFAYRAWMKNQGINYKDLYITSAKVGLTEDTIENQPLTGSLFILRNCGFQGMPAFEFEFEV